MDAKIQRWGNSLGLRIPKAFAEEVGVRAGSAVDLSVKDGELVIRARRTAALSLETLLDQVTADNVHAEVSTGEARGREIW